MKFNKKITFEAAKKRDHLSLLEEQRPGERLRSLTATTLESEQKEEATGHGLSGVFIRIQTDFTAPNDRNRLQRYEDQEHWPREKREEVKKVRFVICILALFGMALGLMSRLMLNVSIVEMVRKPNKIANITELTSASDIELSNLTDNIATIIEEEPNMTTLAPVIADYELAPEEEEGLRFDWSKKEINMILGAFYLGYAPGIMFGGSISERYGSKYPLFVSVFGSAVINFCTPIIARQSLYLLMTSRIALGLMQGSLFPALYALFNRWLTQTESSIFAPMTKVSMPMGSLIGTLMPGLLASFNFPWPLLFYIGGGLCFAWSLVWLYVSTSTPQTNRFVEENELKRIMRKKKPLSILDQPKQNQQSEPSTPWIPIITNPSVLALSLVKFTYNIGIDFVYILLPTYLSSSFNATTETISAISSSCFLVQMLLITFVGWLAKIAVNTHAFGLSVTKWRKVFQGGSNILMASAYLALAYCTPSIELSGISMLIVCSFWMLGAGGESMVPYDLSSKYPASIMGFAHSIAIVSGVAMPIICSIIVGEGAEDPISWTPLFYLIAGLQAFGGIVFCLVLKSKPFLPEERACYESDRAQNSVDDLNK